jgi:transketolase
VELIKTALTDLRTMACRIRIESLKSIFAAGSGHPGGSLSAAEIMAVLFFDQMKVDPSNLGVPLRDRFVLSKGHVAPVLYATLALRGFFPVAELATLRKLDSRLQGHPAYQKPPGVEMTSGSLGQGLSVGLGMRIAGRLRGESFRVYVLVGDGEVQEGQIWEAAMAAAHFKVDHLIAILDYNGVQLDGTVDEIMGIAPIEEKWRAFGWHVLTADGHDVGDLHAKLNCASQLAAEKPVIVIAKTVKGKGVSFMEGKAAWHGISPDPQQMEQAMAELQQRLVEAKR